jgi:hypothetical protein
MMTRPPTADPEKLETKSSVYKKLDPETRRRLNRAIVDRQPATYRGIFEHYNLAKAGVSFTAFYYYAKRVRFHADLRELSCLAPSGHAETPRAIHQLVTERFIDIMLNEELPPRAIERLANAYRMSAALRDSATETRAKADHLQAVRQRFFGKPDPAPARLFAEIRDAKPGDRANDPIGNPETCPAASQEE